MRPCCRLFLHPNNVARVGMTFEFRRKSFSGNGIKLIQKDDGGRCRLCAWRVPCAARGRFCRCRAECAWRSCTSRVRHNVQEIAAREIFDRRAGVGMAQHALGSEHDQRLAPLTHRLPAQHMEVLGGVGRLADLNIVSRRELQIALDARAGVFRALSFVAVREQQDESGQQDPICLRRRR